MAPAVLHENRVVHALGTEFHRCHGSAGKGREDPLVHAVGTGGKPDPPENTPAYKRESRVQQRAHLFFRQGGEAAAEKRELGLPSGQSDTGFRLEAGGLDLVRRQTLPRSGNGPLVAEAAPVGTARMGDEQGDIPVLSGSGQGPTHRNP